MKAARTFILAIVLVSFLTSCDDMFSELIGGQSETPGADLKWINIDPMNNLYPDNPQRTLNNDPYTYASTPCLAVYNGTLFCGWFENQYMRVKQYNGNDSDPQWSQVFELFNSNYMLELCPSAYGLLFGYSQAGDLTVQTSNNEMLGQAFQYEGGNAYNLKLIEFDGAIHAVWEQNGYIRMKRYNRTPNSWDATVEDTYGYGINDNYSPASNCRVTVSNGWLYVAFVEYNYQSGSAYPKLKVRRYNGMHWETASDMMNFYTSSSTGSDSIGPLDIEAHDDGPFVGWMEGYSPDGANWYNRINVRSVWGSWIDNYMDSDHDGTPDYNSGIKWCGNNTTPAFEMECVNVNGYLCALWVEETYDTEATLFYNSIRAAVYIDGWTFLDGNEYYGIGLGYSGYPSQLRAVQYGDGIALVFVDTMTGYANIHVIIGK